MIPGLGAAIRLGRGVHKKHQLEERIKELEALCSTPAISHYTGLKRFEVASALSDAELGEVLDAGATTALLRAEAERHMQVMEKELMAVMDEAASVAATRAEVFALGMALKEVALSFDDSVTAFQVQSDRCLEDIRNDAKTRLGAVDEVQRKVTSLQADLDARVRQLDHNLMDFEHRASTLLSEIEQRDNSIRVALQSTLEQGRQRTEQVIQTWQVEANARLDDLASQTEAGVRELLSEVRAERDAHPSLQRQVNELRADVTSGLSGLKLRIVTLAAGGGLAVLALLALHVH
ncbi:MAG: hypothetical protein JOZ81_33990 [Chloroflexi bacterium]|nr:hypothetical protein [Chloroflexota bacterium]